MVWDSIADASDSDSMNNQAAVYINDEKDAREPRNLSIPIPVIPLIPWRHHRDLALGARTNRVFSDLLLVMGTTLDPTVFPTIADKPRHQKYHFDNETSEATTQEINGQQKQVLTVIKSAKATFTHIDVHFTRGGEKSYAEQQYEPERRAVWENVGIPTTHPTLPVATKKINYDAASSSSWGGTS